MTGHPHPDPRQAECPLILAQRLKAAAERHKRERERTE